MNEWDNMDDFEACLHWHLLHQNMSEAEEAELYGITPEEMEYAKKIAGDTEAHSLNILPEWAEDELKL
ncbi:MAG: hypothetical protein D6732_00175 [Methanobacteriota archaeon]|nr:MAG: hypothetical protein D6732_00175 [Euryarchaeota archaeon]